MKIKTLILSICFLPFLVSAQNIPSSNEAYNSCLVEIDKLVRSGEIANNTNAINGEIIDCMSSKGFTYGDAGIQTPQPSSNYNDVEFQKRNAQIMIACANQNRTDDAAALACIKQHSIPN